MTRKRRIKQIKKEQAVRRQPVSFELEKKPVRNNKWIILSVVAIMFLTLFFNTYFNYTSGVAINEEGKTLGEKYYLLGPDPYYHARIAEYIYYNGEVPYWQEGNSDPLLEYPMEHPNPRPPLFDFILATGAHVLSPFMEDVDALGHSIQFLPALFGALLVIPVYLISSLLFNKRVGVISALFVAIIPIHLGSGHGSAYALADHDSWLLLLTTIGLYFFLKALTTLNEKYTTYKELFLMNKKSIMYAILTGVVYSAVALSWEGFKLIVVLLAVYVVIQLFLNCWFKRDFLGTTMLGTIPLAIMSIIISPYYYIKGTFNDVEIVLSLVAIILFIGLLFHFTNKKIPYIITLPALLVSGIVSLFLINIYQIKPFYYFVGMFFKGSVYAGKVSLTIAEAGSANISSSVMGFGPVLYWVAWFGAIIFMARTLLHKKNYMYFMSLYFILTLYFTMTAGRFLNDFVPFVAIFAGWSTYYLITKVDYKQMFLNMKNLTGFKKLKAIKFLHAFAFVFVVFMLLLPNVVLAFDAAIPWAEKEKYSGLPSGAYGISFGKEQYWTDAFGWLSEQDTELLPEDRPAFISWWDYGFYEIMIGKHPTVADNFQDGIETAANFKTATTEKEAVTVLIARLVHGDFAITNKEKQLSTDVKDILIKYLGQNNTEYIIVILSDLQKSSLNQETILDYDDKICEEYEPELSQEFTKSKFNIYYHTFTKFAENLTDEEVTQFYMGIKKETGWDIRYYGTEQYDMSIFSVFAFLADKSLMPVGGLEDEFYVGYYIAKHKDTKEETKIYSDTIDNLTEYDRQNYLLSGPYFDMKPAFYETMFYKTFYGTPIDDGTLPTNRIPTYNLKHFSAKYISPYVVIAKYYEGYKINGTVICQNTILSGFTIAVFDEFGIKHDSQLMLEDEYNVVVPSGNIYLSFYLADKEIKTFSLNITEEQAMRKTENYNETISIEVEPVNLNGTLYHNETVVSDTDITLVGLATGMFIKVKTDENGYYEFNDIPPSYYNLQTNSTTETVIVYENTIVNLEI